MYFAITIDMSEDLLDKSDTIHDYSDLLKTFFKNKSYGKGIEALYIGIIAVHPKFDFFSIIRKKYTKSKKQLQYNIKLDYEKFKNSNKQEILEMLINDILNSLTIIDELKIKDFDLAAFKHDLNKFFSNKAYLEIEPLKKEPMGKPEPIKQSDLKREFPDDIKLSENIFWELIET